MKISSVGWSVGLFLVISYILCVIGCLLFPSWQMHQAWAPYLPGFEWLSFGSFILGAVESFAYGWYIAVIFVPLYNRLTAQ